MQKFQEQLRICIFGLTNLIAKLTAVGSREFQGIADCDDTNSTNKTKTGKKSRDRSAVSGRISLFQERPGTDDILLRDF